MDITVYTDGACSGNPGRGGYGVVLIYGKHKKELSQGYQLTTNNRMELLAVIVALEALKKPNCNVTIYSDSKYVVDTIQKDWLGSWINKKFKGKKNKDLWLRYKKISEKHNVKFVWVKGHADIPGNELADRLAVEASNKNNLLIDKAYEKVNSGENSLF
ncbi:MAG: ribonuclease HI [Marinifilaceae bacterium]|jgi:ribonuclease HI|nr:ribonuclease HI [Marinifilaceae bacterium]